MTEELKAARNPGKRGIITLPAAILQQDFEIIDEQENHVVLTVRVPLDLIRNNQPSLMALVEIATGKRMVPVEPEARDLDEEG
jgi:hypothetical protein